jgi:hypothetical protein
MRVLALTLSLSLLSASVSRAATFTTAGMQGAYAFRLDGDAALTAHRTAVDSIGVVTMNADGTLGASRALFIVVAPFSDPRISRFEQQGTGTFSVGADGRGTMTITWSPAPPEIPYNEGTFPGADQCSRLIMNPVQQIDFTLQAGGMQMISRELHDYVRDCPAPYDVGNGSTPGLWQLISQGEAVSQVPPCASAAVSPVVSIRR